MQVFTLHVHVLLKYYFVHIKEEKSPIIQVQFGGYHLLSTYKNDLHIQINNFNGN